jgi:hypothetical protein
MCCMGQVVSSLMLSKVVHTCVYKPPLKGKLYMYTVTSL